MQMEFLQVIVSGKNYEKNDVLALLYIMLLTLENPYFVKTKISIKTLFPPDKKDFNSTYEEPL